MCYSVSNEMVHAFQELQNHHRGKMNVRTALPQILAQGARVTSQNQENL